MSPLIKVIISSCVLITLAACSTQPSSSNSNASYAQAMNELSGQNGRACIRTRDIRGYGSESDNRLNINAGSKYYIAKTMYSCTNLDMAPNALFESRFSEACAGTSYIISRAGRCPIQYIWEFDNREAAFTAHDNVEKRMAEDSAEKTTDANTETK